MYGELMNDIRSDVVKAVLTVQVQRQAEPVQPTPIARNIRTNRDGGNGAQVQTVRRSGPDLGRNDPCWCGSGKKYKNCHMHSDRAKAAGQPAPAKQ